MGNQYISEDKHLIAFYSLYLIYCVGTNLCVVCLSDWDITQGLTIVNFPEMTVTSMSAGFKSLSLIWLMGLLSVGISTLIVS